MSEPTKIAMIMGKMIGGGVESVVMNYYKHIDREKVQFDFIIDNDSIVVPEDEIKSLGGRIFRVPPYQHIKAYANELAILFNEQNYVIVHSHINSLSIFPLKVAEKCGVPIRIAHSHSTAAPGEYKKNIAKSFLKLFSTKYPTHYMSPTKKAGGWLFGSQVAEEELFVLKNAIDVDKFSFDKIKRKKIRKRLGYTESDFLIGNIGRMVWQKNQKFVINVFSEVRKYKTDAKLLIIGEGPLKEELINLVKDLDLIEYVQFISNVKNVEDYYQAMDFFLFPSNYEGLGMVAIESQTAGLPTLVSTSIPQDVKVTELCHSISLNENSKTWAEAILNSPTKSREGYNKQVAECGYDIKNSAKLLANQYRKIMENI